MPKLINKTATIIVGATAALSIFALVGCSGISNQNNSNESTENANSTSINEESAVTQLEYSNLVSVSGLTVAVPAGYSETVDDSTDGEVASGTITYSNKDTDSYIAISYSNVNLDQTIEEAVAEITAPDEYEGDTLTEALDQYVTTVDDLEFHVIHTYSTSSNGHTSEGYTILMFAENMHYTINTTNDIDVDAFLNTAKLL